MYAIETRIGSSWNRDEARYDSQDEAILDAHNMCVELGINAPETRVVQFLPADALTEVRVIETVSR